MRALRRRYGHAGGNYSGDPMPSWVREGAYAKVKATPITRKYGLSFGTGEKVWPGDVGVIRAEQGNGWWDWRVHFEFDEWRGNVSMPLTADVLEKLSRTSQKKV